MVDSHCAICAQLGNSWNPSENSWNPSENWATDFHAQSQHLGTSHDGKLEGRVLMVTLVTSDEAGNNMNL